MDNKKNNYHKNRIKGFFRKSAKNGRMGNVEDEGYPKIKEINDIWKENNQTSEDPEMEGDHS